jgi:hypothetical protein
MRKEAKDVAASQNVHVHCIYELPGHRQRKGYVECPILASNGGLGGEPRDTVPNADQELKRVRLHLNILPNVYSVLKVCFMPTEPMCSPGGTGVAHLCSLYDKNVFIFGILMLSN